MSGRFVCTWCALICASREALEAHWAADADCAANRSVSNPTQGKYRDAGAAQPRYPGATADHDVLAVVDRIAAEREAGIFRLSVPR